jgi:hypothetical protein
MLMNILLSIFEHLRIMDRSKDGRHRCEGLKLDPVKNAVHIPHDTDFRGFEGQCLTFCLLCSLK